MENSNKIHDCSEIPDFNNVKLDESCISTIQKKYTLLDTVKFLSGYNEDDFPVPPPVIEIWSKENVKESIAVKILPWSKDFDVLSLRELNVACELNSLKDQTNVFVHVYGYLICKRVHNSWLKYPQISEFINSYKNKDDKNMNIIYMFMEKPSSSFMEQGYYFDREELHSLLFILLHALYVANDRLGFRHQDVHEYQILMDRTNNQKDNNLYLAIKGQEYKVKRPQGMQPKIIDFGKSHTNNYPSDRDGFNDLSSLFLAFEKRYKVHKGKGGPSLGEIKYDSLKKVTDLGDFAIQFYKENLMNTDDGDKPKNSKKIKMSKSQCLFCGRLAYKRYDINTKLRFCNEYCADKIKTMVPFLPN
jgi:hypothetical protein